jgi:7,8-dihydropterin-6-yl-methyl-4-(beta-D-ribofuranosyl)aminobenzene 5'-phosphate synthase
VLPADRLEVVVVVDNWIDIFASTRPDLAGCCSRLGLIEHFEHQNSRPQAEFGIAILLNIYSGDRRRRILFDAGLTGEVVTHNLEVLNVGADSLDFLVLSHGHPDHFGGLNSVLDAAGRRLPLSTHPDAFLPRYAVMADGRTSAFYNRELSAAGLSDAGADLVLSRDPTDLGWGTITSGEIPRVVEFEGPPKEQAPVPAKSGDREPGLYQVGADGAWQIDQVWDEQAIIVNVKDVGLVVVTGCGHAGVLNTIRCASDLLPGYPVHAVLGGFHLGFPTTPRENVEKTLGGLVEHDVKVIMPMHCSGLNTHALYSQEIPERYVQPAVGTTLVFGAA